MGQALTVVSGYVTAPSSTYTIVTPSGTDSFAVQNFYQGSSAVLINAWADIDTLGSARIKSPNLHDNVNGINQEIPAHTPIPFLPGEMQQQLQANDTLNVALTDTATHDPSGITLLEYYSNLPGADANLFRWSDIVGSIVDYMSCLVSIVPGSPTAGDYCGQVVINAVQDQFKASTNYALLGLTTSVQYQTVGITGPDTSNRRVGCPGTSPALYDVRNWFIKSSIESGLPCIPVFNSQNMNATVVDVIDTQAIGDGAVTLFFARLNTPGR